MTSSATLGALADAGVLAIGDGYRTKASEYDDAGLPILRVADVLEGVVSPSYRDRVSLSRLPQIGPKQSRTGDVIVTTKGTVGRVALIPSWLPPHVYSPQLCYLRVLEPSQVDPLWLYSWARSPQLQQQTGSVKDQTDMAPYVSLGDLRRFRIELPPLDEQRRIAQVLGALDDLIDTNERSIAKLAETFDTYAWATTHSTAEVIKLGSKISLQKGVSYKGAFLAESGLPLINLASFSRSGSIVEQGTKFYTGPVPPRKLLRKGDLVVANTDLTQERLLLGRPTIIKHESASSTHHTFQVAVEDMIDRLWVYSLLRHEPRREHLASFATGTTVTALPAEALTRLDVPWPDRETLERWHRVAAPLLDASKALEKENAELRRTRDELLPLLMSGAVRVRPEGVAT